MQKELMKISSLMDDIQNAKHRTNGLWCIGSIFRAQEELVLITKNNFILSNYCQGYEFIEELECLVSTVDQILQLEISEITVDHALYLYEISNDLAVKLHAQLCNTKDITFTSNYEAHRELLKVVEVIVECSKELIEQSRHNIIQTLADDVITTNSNRFEGLECDLRYHLKELYDMTDAELRANLTEQIIKILKDAVTINPNLSESIAFSNKGL